jgi:hypothetical protein
MRQCVQTDLEADRQVASTLAELIISGSLASVEIPDETDDKDEQHGDEAGGGDETRRPDQAC